MESVGKEVKVGVVIQEEVALVGEVLVGKVMEVVAESQGVCRLDQMCKMLLIV